MNLIKIQYVVFRNRNVYNEHIIHADTRNQKFHEPQTHLQYPSSKNKTN